MIAPLISQKWDHQPGPLFEPGSLQSRVRPRLQERSGDAAKANHFPGLAQQTWLGRRDHA